MCRVIRIRIHKMLDSIVVEKKRVDGIGANSRLYCGCCGEVLAETTVPVLFPADSRRLVSFIKNQSFTTSGFGKGIKHTTCGHTMFMFGSQWKFSELEEFVRFQTKNRIQ